MNAVHYHLTINQFRNYLKQQPFSLTQCSFLYCFHYDFSLQQTYSVFSAINSNGKYLLNFIIIFSFYINFSELAIPLFQICRTIFFIKYKIPYHSNYLEVDYFYQKITCLSEPCIIIFRVFLLHLSIESPCMYLYIIIKICSPCVSYNCLNFAALGPFHQQS